jgi:hypothetical protein
MRAPGQKPAISGRPVAEAGFDPVGFAAVDMAGSIPLILVPA